MNHKTFNLFLIVLLSSLAIIVDADNSKTCTKTETGSYTVTFTKSCGHLLPQETNGNWCSKKGNQGNCKGFGETTTITCTPTTTKKICPIPTISKEECCNEGGPGQNDYDTNVATQIGVCPQTVTTPVDCCKCCFDNPNCDYWFFNSAFNFCGFWSWDSTCGNYVNNSQPIVDFGLIGCNICRA